MLDSGGSCRSCEIMFRAFAESSACHANCSGSAHLMATFGPRACRFSHQPLTGRRCRFRIPGTMTNLFAFSKLTSGAPMQEKDRQDTRATSTFRGSRRSWSRAIRGSFGLSRQRPAIETVSLTAIHSRPWASLAPLARTRSYMPMGRLGRGRRSSQRPHLEGRRSFNLSSSMTSQKRFGTRPAPSRRT